ncbi:MAG: Stealth CR1 domain-containing protein [Legionellaceae bacterium]
MNILEPIDAVITWVDGQETAYAKKLQHYLLSQGLKPSVEAAAPTRFHAMGELDYCIRSIERYAPWIRTLYVVTDSQTPSVLEKNLTIRVELIDHQQIFEGYLDALPTFNSVSIEAMLWRIPGLANQFIYFNDDCFLVRPVLPRDFFQDGKMVVRGQMKWQGKKDTFYRQLQEKTAQSVGFKWRYIHLDHAPSALRKDWFEALFLKYHENYINNIRFALRDKQQVWPIAWVYHEAYRSSQILWDKRVKAIMINPAVHTLKKIKARLRAVKRNKQVAFLCVQSLDAADEATFDVITAWLNEL